MNTTSSKHNHLPRFLFLRALAIVHAIAFVSLWVQVDGLIGSRGILPVADYLQRAHAVLGTDAYFRIPTLFWLDASDAALHACCAAGVALSIALFVGFAPRACLVLLWVAYLSLSSAGQDFLSFQWDALLLESTFFAIFYAPSGLRPRLATEAPPSRASLVLMRFLLFRLMFASGAVKLASGDTTWANCTALVHHYETQPLPTPLSWYLHQLPAWAQRAQCVVMFAIELCLPWFAFGPRRMRLAACAAFLLLQLLIAATGNYGFFNLLSIVLGIPLLDDDAAARLFPSSIVRRATAPRDAKREWRPLAVVRAAFAAVVIVFGSMLVVAQLGGGRLLPSAFFRTHTRVAPLRSLNPYGLFAVMTTERPELRVEGSDDGITWKPYVFRYKPGDPMRVPRWVAPHMPRLDWQMWFAALGPPQDSPWMRALFTRLLEGSPPVLALFESNPFPHAPPRQVRAVLDDDRFTSMDERRASGRIWNVEERAVFMRMSR